MCLAGVVLWVASVAVEAPAVSVILGVIIFVGGGLMLVAADSGRS